MSEDIKQPMILSLEGGNAQPLSVRAKALVFSDPVSAELLDYIERIAPSEAPVLIGGETGTGKELVARHIHHLSGRKGPFLAVNCGAISDQLAESELFGHEAGSFTGATGKREGWFEAANGGTLFLDEIGDLPLPLQVKLLRVLQEREVVRIGSRKSIPVDVRLVAATNVDLDYAVNAGHFRRDLLYRINIAHVRLPPLRERPGDILPLAEYFLRNYSQRMSYKKPVFSEQSIDLMLKYAWPGNIRELENVIHFALLVSGEDVIKPEHLKVTGGWEHLDGRRPSSWNDHVPGSVSNGIGVSLNESPLDIIATQLRRLFKQGGDDAYFDCLESLIVHEAFGYSSHNQVHTAALLGISRNVMRTLLKRHGLLRDSSFDESSRDGASLATEHRLG
ncbi:sigma-54 interaction domain-containing protein [Cellvibrio japonicus]|uniref:Sigma54-dependent transcriptional regulator n=1 Tax=Cellvibrio japonicus (strain Ueda107) TaxID=498211 RepID=B3PJX0_CELJU|nr:sigma-54 dependent transcriptional regulator [Cellvibrio japonicus]ACE84255.1 sigma54-dependent transcriptional regulator [Cellvibrio japonicus Ueda107]